MMMMAFCIATGGEVANLPPKLTNADISDAGLEQVLNNHVLKHHPE